MHPLDSSPNASSLASKCLDFESPLMIRSLSENRHSKTQNVNKRERDQSKRGRPRADVLNALMVEGSSSRSRIRCNKCSRVFPREKSLQAHLRTHTGERPYTCDYPGCTKAFCQSGQLKTHQRLHTGERPFACVVEGCTSRFTHANRHCSQHPYASLKRMEMDLANVAKLSDDDPNPEVRKWITKYIKQCQERTNPKSSIKKTPSTENMDDMPLKVFQQNGSVTRSWSLPRIGSSHSLTAPSAPSPPYQPSSLPVAVTYPLSSPTILSPLIPRQLSASSTSSSSSGVSSMSSYSSLSASPSPMPHGLTTFEPHPEAQNYIYSSQMILQGQYTENTNQMTYPSPVAHRSSSPMLLDSGAMDYRTPPSNSPVLPQPLNLHISTTVARSSNSATSGRAATPLLLSKSPTPILPNRPPTPTSPKEQVSNGLCRSLVTSCIDKKSPNVIETTNSISYRATPKNREKDRYISALALIELSKG